MRGTKADQFPRLIRDPERRALTGVSRSEWWRLVQQGRAPRPVKIGRRSTAYVEREILEWIESRIIERDRQRPMAA